MDNSWTDKLKEKMAGYTETPSDDVWRKVSGRAGITPDERSLGRVPAWFLPAVGMAAAAAGILLMLRHDPEMAEMNPPAGMTAEAVIEEVPELTEQKEVPEQTGAGAVTVKKIQNSGRLIADAGARISGLDIKEEEIIPAIQYDATETGQDAAGNDNANALELPARNVLLLQQEIDRFLDGFDHASRAVMREPDAAALQQLQRFAHKADLDIGSADIHTNLIHVTHPPSRLRRAGQTAS